MTKIMSILASTTFSTRASSSVPFISINLCNAEDDTLEGKNFFIARVIYSGILATH